MSISLKELFKAYYGARKNKRKTVSALQFEINYESKLFKLHKELISGRYKINPSICFITFNPVQREVFAADFRDRIVHHLIYNHINPTFEKKFINDSYSCRSGKGTSYGIKRINYFIWDCSQKYKRDCYVLKLDIKGYFMAIDKGILWEKIKKEIASCLAMTSPRRHCEEPSQRRRGNLFRPSLRGVPKGDEAISSSILSLIYQIIFNDPTKNCVIRGLRKDWIGLPKSKSLFFSGKNKGLPIGNLTSQLFSNVYLNDFDHFIKYKLGCQYYGRYVDDFVIVHQDKEFLKSIIPKIRNYLKKELLLELHPNKIYLQHFSKGVKFLGVIIKQNRIYICNRTKGSFYRAIERMEKEIASFLAMTEIATSLPRVAPRNDGRKRLSRCNDGR